jgi:hypothetical protein
VFLIFVGLLVIVFWSWRVPILSAYYDFTGQTTITLKYLGYNKTKSDELTFYFALIILRLLE